jgi:AcrR family transcriptional regulator
MTRRARQPDDARRAAEREMRDPAVMMSVPVEGPPPVAESADSARTSRGEETKARILDAALALFRERGYDETTMRAVAERAGVALGNAYYYYGSKEHLLHGYYARSHEEHLEAARPVLAQEKELLARLRGVAHAKIDVSEPYHRFAALLFRTAADPKSPLSPFSADSAATRRQAVVLMDEVVRGSKKRVPRDLAARLPDLLWLWLMGIILFWIHDDSPRRARTRRLIDSSAELVVRLIGLASNPLLSPLRRSALRMLEETVGAL